MSDEREPEDDLGLDEELMTDFADLFPDDEVDTPAGEALADATADSSRDELDAFFDDFEKNLDVPDTSAANSAAVVASATPGLNPALGKADLDVGLDGEIFMEEVTLDEDELPVTTGQADLPLETPLPVAAVAATNGQATAVTPDAAPSSGGILSPATAPALTRSQRMAAVAALSLSLLLSLGALWMGLGLSVQIETLNQSVGELQQRLLTLSRRGAATPQAELGEQLNRLGERVNDLGVIIEGPMSHLRESSQQGLQALAERIDVLEQRQVPVPVNPLPVAASSKPLVQKVEPVAIAPPSPAKHDGWAINLMSVTSADIAKEELARLRKLGVRAEQQVVNQDGKTWYRLLVPGFDSHDGAKAYIDTVEKQTGFSSAWVVKE
jgi:cell division septation protein DedD